jgi:hypothetical protein
MKEAWAIGRSLTVIRIIQDWVFARAGEGRKASMNGIACVGVEEYFTAAKSGAGGTVFASVSATLELWTQFSLQLVRALHLIEQNLQGHIF